MWELFQSTPPARGATAAPLPAQVSFRISIHAPREGGRLVKIEPEKRIVGFQSTPPARGATVSLQQVVYCAEFQSTPPARGATNDQQANMDGVVFQSTPPARGATPPSTTFKEVLLWHFNPRPPRGGRPVPVTVIVGRAVFQSTPPARGATLYLLTEHRRSYISIHAPREGGDRKDAQFYLRIFDK